MKKTLLMLVAAMFCLVGLNGCGSDKDEPVGDATAVYGFTISQDLFDACDLIVIRYKDNNGGNRMESMSGLSWSKTVTSNQSTATFGYKIELSVKSESELSKDSYNLLANGSIAVTRGGQQSSNSSAIHVEKANCSKSEVGNILRLLEGKTTGYRVDSKGASTQLYELSFN